MFRWNVKKNSKSCDLWVHPWQSYIILKCNIIYSSILWVPINVFYSIHLTFRTELLRNGLMIKLQLYLHINKVMHPSCQCSTSKNSLSHHYTSDRMTLSHIILHWTNSCSHVPDHKNDQWHLLSQQSVNQSQGCQLIVHVYQKAKHKVLIVWKGMFVLTFITTLPLLMILEGHCDLSQNQIFTTCDIN